MNKILKENMRRFGTKNLSEADPIEKENICYRKCEGGVGDIDPNSYESAGESADGESIIKFIQEPDPNYNDGDSKSIRTCLGEDEPLTGRCFNIIDNCATYEFDCQTKKSKW